MDAADFELPDGKGNITDIFFPCFTVASRNNDRTVGCKAFALRLLGMMPSIWKAATVAKTDAFVPLVH
jgi:hypothetical protein